MPGRNHLAVAIIGTVVFLAVLRVARAPDRPPGGDHVDELIAALAGPDASAEFAAVRRLEAMGDEAVPALAELARRGSYPARMNAVELLGRIGTPPALDRLIDQLATEKTLAVRGQICIQLGQARDRRAVPVLCAWLKTIGPKALNDVPGPKEAQPSTTYVRHLEALAMIGDEGASDPIQEFRQRIPQGIGYGGFITKFVTSAADESLEAIAEQKAFWTSVRKAPGLEARALRLLAQLRADAVSRFRLLDDEVIRRTHRGREALESLADGSDAEIAATARELLSHYGNP